MEGGNNEKDRLPNNKILEHAQSCLIFNMSTV